MAAHLGLIVLAYRCKLVHLQIRKTDFYLFLFGFIEQIRKSIFQLGLSFACIADLVHVSWSSFSSIGQISQPIRMVLDGLAHLLLRLFIRLQMVLDRNVSIAEGGVRPSAIIRIHSLRTILSFAFIRMLVDNLRSFRQARFLQYQLIIIDIIFGEFIGSRAATSCCPSPREDGCLRLLLLLFVSLEISIRVVHLFCLCAVRFAVVDVLHLDVVLCCFFVIVATSAALCHGVYLLQAMVLLCI